MSYCVRRTCGLIGLLIGAALPFQAAAEVHALIMTISEYTAPGANPLKGVQQDGRNARDIARLLGVRDANMVFLRDQELTVNGMRAAFDGLERRIRADDQVFIYYSGHGGRQLVNDGTERCAESLVTVDGNPFIDAELEARLKMLSHKAEKLVVFLDACHSGGVTTRSANQSFAPKYYAKGGGDTCAVPVNILKRNLTFAARSAGSGAQNYVYIAAAKDNEVSLDQPGKGGVATQAWLECLGGAAKDLDGSGAISAEEVRICAQERIDAKLRNVAGYSTHHISITGNSNAVLAFAKAAPPPPPPVLAALPAVPPPVAAPTPPTRPPAATAPAPTVAAVTRPPVPIPPPPSLPGLPSLSSLPAPPQVPEVAVSPINTLKDIFSRRDDRRTVTLTAARPTFKIGRDKVQFTLTSSHAGYVYLLMVGSDGKEFDMLFPNQLDKDNQIAAGQTLSLPRPNWQITAGGPAGKDQLLAMVTDAPRDFSKLKLTPAGPFSVVAANPVSAKDIQFVTSISSNASSDECGDEILKRNLRIAKSCSNAFGAAMISIEEVN